MFENVGLSVHSALGVGVVLHTSGPVLESGRVERAEGVGHNRRLLLVNLVQKRGEDPPRLHIHSHIRVRLKIIRNLETMHDSDLPTVLILYNMSYAIYHMSYVIGGLCNIENVVVYLKNGFGS